MLVWMLDSLSPARIKPKLLCLLPSTYIHYPVSTSTFITYRNTVFYLLMAYLTIISVAQKNNITTN